MVLKINNNTQVHTEILMQLLKFSTSFYLVRISLNTGKAFTSTEFRTWGSFLSSASSSQTRSSSPSSSGTSGLEVCQPEQKMDFIVSNPKFKLS